MIPDPLSTLLSHMKADAESGRLTIKVEDGALITALLSVVEMAVKQRKAYTDYEKVAGGAMSGAWRREMKNAMWASDDAVDAALSRLETVSKP